MGYYKCKNCGRLVRTTADTIYDGDELVGWEFECPVCHEWNDIYLEDLEKRANDGNNELPF